MPFLFRDGNLSEISSVTEYLLGKSSSLYTTMRFSSKYGKIFELEMHLQRVKASELESEEIKEMLKRLPMTTDLRITLIRSSIGFEFVYEEMPILKISSCQVEIRQAKRENVQEKNSQWVKDRKVFEDSKLPESNEVILSDEDGNLFEGLSSNFFVILSDGSLQTAPMESVLTGTVMRKVLRDWKFSQIVFENPKISEIDTWQGAFITSTSRLILPIDKIIRGNCMHSIPLNENVSDLRNIFETEIK